MSGSKVPPAFEKKPNCQKCNGSFGFLTRQHHCRNCGKSFCEKCSSKQLPIPQYGFVEPVRVCDPCFTSIQQSSRTTNAKAAPKAESASVSPSAASAPATGGASAGAPMSSPAAREQAARAAGAPTTKPRSDSADEAIRDHDDPPVVAVVPTKKVSNCTCGLPFCICPPDKVVEAPKEERKVDNRPKSVAAAPAKRVETAPASSSFVGLGRRAPAVTYDLKGDLNEQTRDAIKAGDVAGVQTLLNARAEARFIDRTGNSLVHLAAMFNQLDVVTMLVRSGANIWEKNPAGETPVDLAPPSLANKMKELQPTAGAAPATTA